MFESLIATEIARTVVGLAVGFWLWNYLRREEEIPCKRCEHLEIIGGAVYKYECRRKGQYNGFDRPPRYCKYFKERRFEEDKENG